MACTSSDADSSEEAKMLSEFRAETRSAGNHFWRPLSVVSLAGIAVTAIFFALLVAFKANPQQIAKPPKPQLKFTEHRLQPTLELRTVELQLPGPWINRHQLVQEEMEQVILSANVTRNSGADARHLSSSCNSGLHHLVAIGKQALTPPDTLFPASASSIAPSGSNCGDTAKGEHVSCAKFNKWTTFQDIAKAKNKHFSVIGKRGPNWHDVGQGELGVCYFLAAVASVAHDDPMVISRMFIHKDKWAKGVYTTKWFINGHETTVAVDSKVPGRGAYSFFAQPSDTGEWWPVILEKAWAKIFKNYKATESGTWVNPVLAITGAPVFRVSHEDVSDDELWAVLVDATTEHWPAGAGTGNAKAAQSIGLALGHAYSVFNASTHSTHGRVIQCYNPWGEDHYKGVVHNDNKEDGIFQMTLAEYKASFQSTTFAHVHTSFTPISKLIQTAQSKASAWEFTVASSGKFYVSVTWPNARMTKQCIQEQPRVTLAVSKKGSSKVHMAEEGVFGANSQSVKITDGAGDYVASAVVDFPATDQAHEVRLVVYGKDDQVSITPGNGDADDTLLSLIGAAKNGKACSTISFAGMGLFIMETSVPVNGVPTFWSHDGGQFAYWEPKSLQWWVVTKSRLDQVQAGELWSSAKFSKDHIICGCQDDPEGVAGFNGGVHCNEVKGQAAKYSNVACEAAEYSRLVQTFCPVTCGVSACSGSTTGPMPAPAPRPAPPAGSGSGGTGSQCKDRTGVSIKVNGKQVTCADTDLCKEVDGFEELCCSSCATAAENGDMSSGSCKDRDPPGITLNSHKVSKCSELKGHCSNGVVRDSCCTTCKAHDDIAS